MIHKAGGTYTRWGMVSTVWAKRSTGWTEFPDVSKPSEMLDKLLRLKASDPEKFLQVGGA